MFVVRDWVIRNKVRRSWMVCIVAGDVSEIHGEGYFTYDSDVWCDQS